MLFKADSPQILDRPETFLGASDIQSLIATAANEDLIAGLRQRYSNDNLNGFSSNKLISLIANLEQVGRVIDHERVMLAGLLEQQFLENAGVSEAASGLGMDHWADETSGSADNADEKVSCKQEEDPVKNVVGMADSFGCKNSTELLTRITGASTKAVRERLRLHKDIQQVVSLCGDKFPARYQAVSLGLNTGLLSVEIASQLVRDFNRIRPRASVSELQVAELALVMAAIGAEMPLVGEVAPDDTLLVRDAVVAAFNRVDELTTAGCSQPHIPAGADSVRVMTEPWLHFLDPVGTTPSSEERVLEQRYFHIGRTIDGLVPVRGKLLPEVAALLGRAFDAVTSPRTKKETLKMTKVALERSSGQKRHDAFASLLQKAVKSADMPLLGGAPVTVLIEVKEESLLKQETSASEPGVGLLHNAHGDIEPITIAAVKHSGCSGAIQKIVLDRAGKIVRLGGAERVFNHHARKSITVRDGGCVVPDCNTGASWCEVHHVQEYARGGPTHVDNGVLLCWWHHRTIDTSGWEIQMREGTPWVRPPEWIHPDRPWQKHRHRTKQTLERYQNLHGH